jgi:hypothetical protein
MERQNKQFLISTLMESALYFALPLQERQLLMSRLTKSYPSLFTLEGCAMDMGNSLEGESREHKRS